MLFTLKRGRLILSYLNLLIYELYVSVNIYPYMHVYKDKERERDKGKEREKRGKGARMIYNTLMN